MPPPKTFVSSTAYDLKDARARLRKFLHDELGHDPLMHEDPGFGVTPGLHSHDACLEQVDVADFFVLIIGGRFGGMYTGGVRSITNEEYNRAKKRDLPIIIFVKSDVAALHQVYKKNPGIDTKPTVDNPKIFDFIDRVRSEITDNWTFEFADVEDIVQFLRGQFAHFHYLFAKAHRDRNKPTASAKPKGLKVAPFPSSLDNLPGMDEDERTSFIAGLKKVHEAIQGIAASDPKRAAEKLKVLWVMGSRGKHSSSGLRPHLTLSLNLYKEFAGHGVDRARRIMEQMAPFGVDMEWDTDYHDTPTGVDLRFTGAGNEDALYALEKYAKALLKRHKDDGLELFAACDLSLYK